jgi:putative tryptophan/tyrosine transport system substrate-binding protein
MRRREFIALLGGAATAWPLAARAQQPERVRRIGVLSILAESDVDWRASIKAFQHGLQELGWTDGRNIQNASAATINPPFGSRAKAATAASMCQL